MIGFAGIFQQLRRFVSRVIIDQSELRLLAQKLLVLSLPVDIDQKLRHFPQLRLCYRFSLNRAYTAGRKDFPFDQNTVILIRRKIHGRKLFSLMTVIQTENHFNQRGLRPRP